MKTRLIDADKLVDSLRASMNHGRETFPVDLIVEAIDEQPTIKYIEQISRDDIEDICFKLTCYYIATTELYDRSLTDERRVETILRRLHIQILESDDCLIKTLFLHIK